MSGLKTWLFVMPLTICTGLAVHTRSLSQTVAVPLAFEVASIKPSQTDGAGSFGTGACRGIETTNVRTIAIGRCRFTQIGLRGLILRAYPPVQTLASINQVTGGPSWIDETYFDVEAKAEDSTTIRQDQLRQMLQALLKDRFKLAFHKETKDISGYVLVTAKDGFKLKELTGPANRGAAPPGAFMAFNVTMQSFALILSTRVKAPVVDKTGISGRYNIPRLSDNNGNEPAAPIFTSLQEEVGLRLEPQKIPYEFIVIDHAEKPSEPAPGNAKRIAHR